MTDRQLTVRISPLPSDRPEPPLNIFQTLRRNRPLSKGFLALGAHLLRGGVLPDREREIVILRVGWRCASEYEFGQHTSIGELCGLTPVEVSWLAGCGTPAWSPADAALVRLADELCADNVVSDATWAELAQRWSEPELLELVMLGGFYRMVSGVLNSAGVPLEPQTPGWPDGAEATMRAPRVSAP